MSFHVHSFVITLKEVVTIDERLFIIRRQVLHISNACSLHISLSFLLAPLAVCGVFVKVP